MKKQQASISRFFKRKAGEEEGAPHPSPTPPPPSAKRRAPPSTPAPLAVLPVPAQLLSTAPLHARGESNRGGGIGAAGVVGRDQGDAKNSDSDHTSGAGGAGRWGRLGTATREQILGVDSVAMVHQRARAGGSAEASLASSPGAWDSGGALVEAVTREESQAGAREHREHRPQRQSWNRARFVAAVDRGVIPRWRRAAGGEAQEGHQGSPELLLPGTEPPMGAAELGNQPMPSNGSRPRGVPGGPPGAREPRGGADWRAAGVPGKLVPLAPLAPGDKYTPLEQQVVELKGRHPDVVLLVEVGYKYRFFGEDARVAADVLGIWAHPDHHFLTASIPTFRLHVHVRRLVQAGYKVGVVRQTETAALKAQGANRSGPFTRGLSALYTMATLEAGEDLGGEESEWGGAGASLGEGGGTNFLLCIVDDAGQPLEPLRRHARRRTRGSAGARAGSAPASAEAGASQGGFAAGVPLSQDSTGSGGEVLSQGEPSSSQGSAGRPAGERGDTLSQLALVAVEASTGAVKWGQFCDGVLRAELESWLATLAPAEIILGTPITPATEKAVSLYVASQRRKPRVVRSSREQFLRSGGEGGALAELADFFSAPASGQEQGGRAPGASDSATQNGSDRVSPRLEALLSMPALVVQGLALLLEYLKEFGLQDLLLLDPLYPQPTEGTPPLGTPALEAPDTAPQTGRRAGVPSDGERNLRASRGEGFAADEGIQEEKEDLAGDGSVQEGEGPKSEAEAGAWAGGASPSPFCQLSESREMRLSANALEQLEVLGNSVDGAPRGSLWGLMNRTLTPFGARLLRHWRQASVTELRGGLSASPSLSSLPPGTYPGSKRGGGAPGAASRGATAGRGAEGGGPGGGGRWVGLLESVLKAAAAAGDLERGLMRIFHRTATPIEFLRVVSTLHAAACQLSPLVGAAEKQTEPCGAEEGEGGPLCQEAVQSPLVRRLLAEAASASVRGLTASMLAVVDRQAAASGDKANLIVCSQGRFPEVAACRAAIKEAEEELEALLPALRKATRNPSLTYFSVAGTSYLIELPAAQAVPRGWLKVNSTKKTTRYHPPEVLRAYDRLAVAQEATAAACSSAWQRLLLEFRGHACQELRRAVAALAHLDCLHSLALLSCAKGYCAPVFADDCPGGAQVLVSRGRHPILEATMADAFVPNDTELGGGGRRCHIITGPNMGGKSCYIRQVALICLMAQMGSYVPADAVTMTPLDGVFTRMGGADNIFRGRSTFLEELSEASSILAHATPRSLVIMDELGRGTSTHDGTAIADATLQYLVQEVKCLTLFVTHYPWLAHIAEELPQSVGTFHASFVMQDAPPPASPEGAQGAEAGQQARISFLYKLVPGVARSSFGLNVARMAQVPEPCIQRAAEMASRLAREIAAKERGPRPATSAMEAGQVASVLQPARSHHGPPREDGQQGTKSHEFIPKNAQDAVRVRHILKAWSRGDPQELLALQRA